MRASTRVHVCAYFAPRLASRKACPPYAVTPAPQLSARRGAPSPGHRCLRNTDRAQEFLVRPTPPRPRDKLIWRSLFLLLLLFFIAFNIAGPGELFWKCSLSQHRTAQSGRRGTGWLCSYRHFLVRLLWLHSLPRVRTSTLLGSLQAPRQSFREPEKGSRLPPRMSTPRTQKWSRSWER